MGMEERSRGIREEEEVGERGRNATRGKRGGRGGGGGKERREELIIRKEEERGTGK